MARYTESVCRLCRREGTKLFLKGARCNNAAKCAVEKRPYAPGMHGKGGRFKTSDYGIQLREKQKVKRIYGVLERQFRNYFRKADAKKGVTGTVLLRFLEMRLDNVVYRMGLASSRAQARQFLLHGFIFVNGRKTDIPSYVVSVGDEITVSPKCIEADFYKNRRTALIDKSLPLWLEFSEKENKGKILRAPEREDISDVNIEERLIIELYSK